MSELLTREEIAEMNTDPRRWCGKSSWVLHDSIAATLKHQAEQIAELKRIAIDLAWLARRYCDGRQTYAPSIYNEHARALLEMGVQLNATGDGLIWAKDGDGIDGLSEECHIPGHPEATGHVIPLPRGTHLARELEGLLGKDVTAAVVRIRAMQQENERLLKIVKNQGPPRIREIEREQDTRYYALQARFVRLERFAESMVTIDAMGNVELEFAYKRIGEMAVAALATATEEKG